MDNLQERLTDKEMESLQNVLSDTLASICDMADKHNIDRDSMLKYFANMITVFAELASIQNYKASRTCNRKHNHNSNSDEQTSLVACVTARFLESDNTINKVTSLEIIARTIDSKPYYGIKYKKIGEDYYHVGYSSYNLNNVLKWYSECFELVNVKMTNADRIRSMSDKELAIFLATDFTNYFGEEYEGEKSCLYWLQSPINDKVSEMEDIDVRR